MLCLFGIQLQAQQMTYHDASCFPLLGKATQDTGARYERLPDSLKNISRPPLWNLSRINPEKPDVPLNKNDAFQKVQKRRVQEKR